MQIAETDRRSDTHPSFASTVGLGADWSGEPRGAETPRYQLDHLCAGAPDGAQHTANIASQHYRYHRHSCRWIDGHSLFITLFPELLFLSAFRLFFTSPCCRLLVSSHCFVPLVRLLVLLTSVASFRLLVSSRGFASSSCWHSVASFRLLVSSRGFVSSSCWYRFVSSRFVSFVSSSFRLLVSSRGFLVGIPSLRFVFSFRGSSLCPVDILSLRLVSIPSLRLVVSSAV